MSKHGLRRNSSLKHDLTAYDISKVENTKNKDEVTDIIGIKVISPNSKDEAEAKKGGPNDSDDEKEEVKISGCRRRIMNRPNKRNSKSKSFCEQRKFRSHSPMPERKQNLNEQSVKTKVLYPLNLFLEICYMHSYY